jgi:hypothetical protein
MYSSSPASATPLPFGASFTTPLSFYRIQSPSYQSIIHEQALGSLAAYISSLHLHVNDRSSQVAC